MSMSMGYEMRSFMTLCAPPENFAQDDKHLVEQQLNLPG